MKRAFPSLLLLLLLSLAARPLTAQHALAEGGPYDPAIPTPASVLGYELGSRFTPHYLILRYAAAVANASPRVRLDTVATTWEGRPVLLLTVTSEANQARLAELKAGAQRLADPRGASKAELDRLVETMPTIVWLGYTVHGDEASGAEAALATLYQLAAGQDEETLRILDNTVALIDPVENPDGHERHVEEVGWDLGKYGPDPYPLAMVHNHDWHGARSNHYLFDLNRDWIMHANPETRGRMAVFRTWYPHVAADLHEMGASSTYFFAPPMEPINENISPLVRKGWPLFAQGNAAALAAHGWGFFTHEGFDEFFPGYGPYWPIMTGAIGMTYEEGSSEGGAVRRDDGTIITLREAAMHHYATSRATLVTAADHRRDRVADYLAFHQAAIADNARAPMRTIVFSADAQGRGDSLAALLRRDGIEVGRLTRPAEVRRATSYEGTEPGRIRVPAGTYVVDLSQPQGTLARSLLEPDPAFSPEFIQEELARRERGERNRFYDMTGWALPFLFRVDAWWTPQEVGPTETVAGLVPESEPQGAALPARATYAYVFEPGGTGSTRLLARLLADSVRVRHAPRAFRVGDASFPHGALVVLVNRNGDGIHEEIRDAAAATGARVVAVDNALVDTGTDLGSNSVAAIPIPRVLLVGGEGISTSSYGAAWFTFDQLLDYPVTRVELSDLTRALNDFDVVILPSGYGIGSRLGNGATAELRRWVGNGGTLITLDASTEWLASEDGLARLRVASDSIWDDDGDGRHLSMSVPGAILRTLPDTLSPILAGVTTADVPVLLFGDRIYEAPDDVRPGEVVLRYADEDRLRLAGYVWPEVPSRVAGTPYLWTERYGRGRLIAFTADPNFRVMWRGLTPIFANAVFLGGSF